MRRSEYGQFCVRLCKVSDEVVSTTNRQKHDSVFKDVAFLAAEEVSARRAFAVEDTEEEPLESTQISYRLD